MTPQARNGLIYDSMDNEVEESKEENKGQSIRRPRPATDSRSFLDTVVTNQIYKYSYGKEMVERLDFLRFIVVQNPQTLLKASHIQILWESLVTNAFYERERD
jgi:hypothetical protein